MITTGIILFFLSVIFTAYSISKYYWVITLCFFSGVILLEAGLFLKNPHYHYTDIAPAFLIYCLIFYAISVRKIMNLSFFDTVKHGEFKEFLEENDKFNGYNKFIYYFPGVILFLGAIYCILYYI